MNEHITEALHNYIQQQESSANSRLKMLLMNSKRICENTAHQKNTLLFQLSQRERSIFTVIR
jgi:hypothetical protein